MRSYTFRQSKLQRACMEGIRLGEEGRLFPNGRDRGFLWLPPLDGGVEKDWGRLVVDGQFPEESILKIYAAAGEDKEKTTGFLLDPSVSAERKQGFFSERGTAGKPYAKSALLYEHTGRYLWIGLEWKNAEKGWIDRIKVCCPGDFFLETLPQVYRERGGVLHRYLSAFSSVYEDFREETGRIWERFDPERAGPSELAAIGEWFGIHMGEGLLKEQEMRELAGNVCRFVRMKGTPAVVRELTVLLTGEPPLMVEKGNADVTLLLSRKLTEDEELRLLYFLRQFVPAYSRLNILSSEEENRLDSCCFADRNARIPRFDQGILDEESSLDTCVSQ